MPDNRLSREFFSTLRSEVRFQMITLQKIYLPIAPRRHEQKHKSIGERQFPCHTCPMAFHYQKDLDRHLLKHGDPQYFCDVSSCKGSIHGFKRMDKLENHTRNVHGGADAVNIFSCGGDSCHETFRSNSDLRRHERCKHRRAKTVYTCGVVSCRRKDKMWHRLDNLRLHVKSQHRDQSVDRCIIR